MRGGEGARGKGESEREKRRRKKKNGRDSSARLVAACVWGYLNCVVYACVW